MHRCCPWQNEVCSSSLPEPAALLMLCSISSTVSMALSFLSPIHSTVSWQCHVLSTRIVTCCITVLYITSNVSKSPLLFITWYHHIFVQVFIFHHCSITHSLNCLRAMSHSIYQDCHMLHYCTVHYIKCIKVSSFITWHHHLFVQVFIFHHCSCISCIVISKHIR